MVIVSKRAFEKAMDVYHCSDIVHPWARSCTQAGLKIVIGFLKGSSKFFAIVYAVRTLVKWRKISMKYLKQELKSYPRSILYGAVMGITAFTSLCILRNILRKFYYYTIAFIPGLLGGFAIFIETPFIRNLCTVFFFNMVLKLSIRWFIYEILKKRYVWIETGFFMIFSAVLMHLLRTKKHRITNLWFFTPPTYEKAKLECQQENNQIKNQQNGKCIHSQPCWQHLLNVIFFASGFTKGNHFHGNCFCSYIVSYWPGFSKYFLVGYGLQLAGQVSGLMKNAKHPKILARKLLSRKVWKFGLFLGSYVAIYRVITCYLFKSYGKDNPRNTMIAGFFAGTSYAIQPSIDIPIIAFTTILQVFWSELCEKRKLPMWPFTEVLFAFCNAILFHSRLVMPEYCPKYVHDMMQICTDNQVDQMYERFLKVCQNEQLTLS